MLVWVASYPRSGNTLTLRTLADVFGINRFCTIHEPDLWMRKRNRGYEIPEELEGLDQAELLEALKARPEPFFIKSHRREDGDDDAPALYIVRDGRDVHVSYTHWTEDRKFNVRGKADRPRTCRSRSASTRSSREGRGHVTCAPGGPGPRRRRSSTTRSSSADPAGVLQARLR